MVNLFLYQASDVNEAGEVVINDKLKVEHLLKVLKVEVGSELKFGLVGGGRGVGTVTRLEKDAVVFTVLLDEQEAAPEKKSGISFLMPCPRPSMVKLLLERMTTAGVDHVYLIRSERSTKQYFQGKPLRDDLMAAGILKGAEQGATTRLSEFHKYPDVEFPRFMQSVWPGILEGLHSEDSTPVLKLLAHPGMKRNMIQAVKRALEAADCAPSAACIRVVLAVGPEGGWIPPEIGALKQAGFIPFHCGQRILRVDQAAQALLGQLQLVCDSLPWILDAPQPEGAEEDEVVLEEELQDVAVLREARTKKQKHK